MTGGVDETRIAQAIETILFADARKHFPSGSQIWQEGWAKRVAAEVLEVVRGVCSPHTDTTNLCYHHNRHGFTVGYGTTSMTDGVRCDDCGFEVKRAHGCEMPAMPPIPLPVRVESPTITPAMIEAGSEALSE